MQTPDPAPAAGWPLRLGAVFGALAVGLGAFAAHAMKTRYDEVARNAFEVGVRYQTYHALALLLCGALQRTGLQTRAAATLFAIGIVMFSGSLYGLALTTGWNRLLGPITPIGGIVFLAGWVTLAFAGRRKT